MYDRCVGSGHHCHLGFGRKTPGYVRRMLSTMTPIRLLAHIRHIFEEAPAFEDKVVVPLQLMHPLRPVPCHDLLARGDQQLSRGAPLVCFSYLERASGRPVKYE